MITRYNLTVTATGESVGSVWADKMFREDQGLGGRNVIYFQLGPLLVFSIWNDVLTASVGETEIRMRKNTFSAEV